MAPCFLALRHRANCMLFMNLLGNKSGCTSSPLASMFRVRQQLPMA
jgi:hypothetical protein